MPRLIKDGVIVEDNWAPAGEAAAPGAAQQIYTLEQWLALADKTDSAVQLEADEPPAPLLDHLDKLSLIVIHFHAFMDGRGFSYARELREKGYTGELRAAGHFIRDQLTYMQRVGFNAFAMADDSQLEAALESLNQFTEFYQASVDQPLPLFRRR